MDRGFNDKNFHETKIKKVHKYDEKFDDFGNDKFGNKFGKDLERDRVSKIETIVSNKKPYWEKDDGY